MEPMRAPSSVALALAAALGVAPAAGAEGAAPGAPAAAEAAPAAETADAKALRKLMKPAGGYLRLLGGVALGDGVRFNNPYRLRTQLGDTPESLSLTSGYVDFGAAMAFGPPDGFQHGVSLRLSVALAGVPQQVLSPSYLVVHRGSRRVMGFGRLGVAYVVSPDENLGGELGVGAAYFLTAGVGVSAELIGGLYYGAGTFEVATAVYPILSGQIGVIVDYEVLP